MDELTKWRKEYKHVPEFMDDSRMYEFMTAIMKETFNYAERHGYPQPNSVFLHCWLYDVVLWRLAACGWTIQRSRKKGLNFRSIQDYIDGVKKWWK